MRESLALLSHAGSFGKLIRTHGDLHLGQTLWAPERDDWALIDFEGEPARSLAERRRKRSPLRDVAGMLRSFAYAVSAVEILRGAAAPEGWEQRAREEFLEGLQRDRRRRACMPAGDAAFERLLTVFELEKAVYELRYELNNRPEWIHIPVAGILRMLEAAATRMSRAARGSATSTSTSRARDGTSSSTRSSARTSRDDGVVVRGVGAERDEGLGRRRVERLGRPREPDGAARLVGHLGDRRAPTRPRARSTATRSRRATVTLLLKSDPYAFAAEMPPGNASRIFRSRYEWGDDAWLERRRAVGAVHAADVDLRGASRLVAAHARQPAARLPRARRAARRRT